MRVSHGAVCAAVAYVACVACAACAASLGAQTGRDDPGLRRLEQEIVHLSIPSGGKVGVGIIHLETGRELFVKHRLKLLLRLCRLTLCEQRPRENDP